MGSVFLDTNVFLRFLTNDDPAKAKRAETLLLRAATGVSQNHDCAPVEMWMI